ncbi:hypothetical protein INT45_012694 [Circinella minor]|uniref:F-box domain-containing protein n=1 Tax=Circinella minor TaxID=1195481 RepID=A0A8H7VE91_9FUNG|nr:hypothetical protein INT45_012694 [Circinella minor]
MSTTSSVTTTTTIINTAIPLSSFEKVKNAYNHRDYGELIRQATNTIVHIEQLELLLMLEHRAHALGMKSKFGAAEQDAETMIKYAPTLPQSYLCFGKILSMQGKQKRALKVYQEGLEKVPTNHLAYGQLLQAKKMADEKNNQHFDLVSALPLEVKDEIVKLLSEAERSNLFDVSTTWSQRLENCQEAWKYIYNDHDHNGDIAVSQVLSKIAKHINHLTITTTEENVWLKYLGHLENGHFRNLKSLVLTDDMVVDVFCTNSITSLMNGFWKMRYTLTNIDLRFYKYGTSITITDILFHLPYLKKLFFLVRDSLAEVLGELEVLQEPHRSLIDFTLSTSSTSSDALKSLTRWCPYVRRLRLEEATPSALDIVTDYFLNVEMLGYNNGYELPVSHEVLNQDHNNNEPIIPIIGMNNMYTKQEQGRLRAFYSGNGWEGVSGDEFLRLLQKNQKTLEIIHANMGITSQQDLDGEPYDNFRPDYAREAASVVLNLDRLQKIMFWPDIYGVYEPLFCRMVGPSLKYFKSVGTSDLFAVVDTLINSQEILETLGFAQVFIESNDQDNALAAQCWIRLFNKYAVTSLPGPNTTKKLRNVMLDYCYNISDNVLDALANIKTIKGLSFQGNSRITRQGFKNFFIKLNKQNVQITKLILGSMNNVLDRNMLFDIISIMDELEALHLYDIKWVTSDDIKVSIHSAKKLNTLVLKRCDADSGDIIAFVNSTSRKFKYVKIIEYLDLDSDFDFDTFN